MDVVHCLDRRHRVYTMESPPWKWNECQTRWHDGSSHPSLYHHSPSSVAEKQPNAKSHLPLPDWSSKRIKWYPVLAHCPKAWDRPSCACEPDAPWLIMGKISIIRNNQQASCTMASSWEAEQVSVTPPWTVSVASRRSQYSRQSSRLGHIQLETTIKVHSHFTPPSSKETFQQAPYKWLYYIIENIDGSLSPLLFRWCRAKCLGVLCCVVFSKSGRLK